MKRSVTKVFNDEETSIVPVKDQVLRNVGLTLLRWGKNCVSYISYSIIVVLQLIISPFLGFLPMKYLEGFVYYPALTRWVANLTESILLGALVFSSSGILYIMSFVLLILSVIRTCVTPFEEGRKDL